MCHQGLGNQPPSGGCVLKLYIYPLIFFVLDPAAFGRLCVETEVAAAQGISKEQPAAFGRLCVETCHLAHGLD